MITTAPATTGTPKAEARRNVTDITILIVDDDADARFLLRAILEEEGYRIEEASHATEALEIATRISPDVILLDVVMPEIDGFELCRMIRNQPEIAEVPVIMLTSLTERSHLLNGLEAGADDYVAKPFDALELRARLQTITRLNRYRQLVQGRASVEAAHARLIAAYDATIVGWSLALDLRDKETEGHSRRVTVLTETLAAMAGITGDDLITVRRGALLHDIGKLGVPDAILHKPGPLTDEEWAIMRQHPQYACNMIEPIEYLRPSIDIPHCHHEKWDGTGYPRGLKGEEIPLAARIFAVVDVWDALTSERPYRKAWDRQKTLDHIREQSGTHFDPRVVEMFCEMIIKFEADT